MKKKTIYQVCRQVDREILGDFGGGSPLSKILLMSYLAKSEQLKTYVEIGVYKGRSLFPTAYSISNNGGMSYGIDPYELSEALELDVDPDLKTRLDDFLRSTNFEKLHSDVLEYKHSCSYGDSIQIIRKPSAIAYKDLELLGIYPDLLHIDGNHDTHKVMGDFIKYWHLLRDRSYIVFDDIDWPSVMPAYNYAKEKCLCVFETQEFGILMKISDPAASHDKATILERRLTAIYRRVNSIQHQESDYIPTIAVGVLTYNHSSYIKKALSSIFAQSGYFNLKVIICDDASSDDTVDNIRAVMESADSRTEVNLLVNQSNVGMRDNFLKLIHILKGSKCDYFTFCEGDDYYLAHDRISQLIDLADRNPEAAVLWNRLCIYYEEDDNYQIFHPSSVKDIADASDLIIDNFIGSFSASFLRGDVLEYVDSAFDDVELFADWYFHLFCSQYGDIQLLNQPMTMYRKHRNGYWSSRTTIEKAKILLSQIDAYDMKLGKVFSTEFQVIKDSLRNTLMKPCKGTNDEIDLLIIDNIFPSRLSGFRYEEYIYLLRNIPNATVLASGRAVTALGNQRHSDNITQFRGHYPDLATRIVSTFDFESCKPRLLYTIFIDQLYNDVLPLAEAYQIPFAFTLYPGGAFGINNLRSDKMLRRAFASPFFSKVIVTQEVTLTYLLENGFCSPDKIEYIYGVPTPGIAIAGSYERCTKQPGVDRPLNICFVAHKYTANGNDKGYDVFLRVVEIVTKRLSNVAFHVVGPWCPDDISLLSADNPVDITYYGTRDQEWFDSFYRDKDILLSPNTNGMIYPGSFDGFPTGCATDAALRGVALLVTDPLEMNSGKFQAGQDLVIIPRDATEISQLICYLYDNPNMLSSIGARGCLRVRQLFSVENQLLPRLAVIKKCLDDEAFLPDYKSLNDSSLTNDVILRKAISLLARVHQLSRNTLPASPFN